MTANELPKFWSDDFDMDLLKVYPNIVEALGATVHETIWTVGQTLSHGRLNHTEGWNTSNGELCGYFWLTKPNLARDEHGWFNICGHVASSKEIECTWLELLRDTWVHHIGMRLLPSGELFTPAAYRTFERLMYHFRDWIKDDDIDSAHADGWRWAMESNRQFARLVEIGRLTRGELAPYYAAESVPGFNGPKIDRERPPALLEATKA